MRIHFAFMALIGLAMGLGGCLGSPSPLGPSAALGCLPQADIVTISASPSKIPSGPHHPSTTCPLPAFSCAGDTQVIRSRSQLLALETSCGGPAPGASCTNPCNFGDVMLLGYFANVSCMASGLPAFSSVCYTKDQVVVTITQPTIPTQVPGGIQYQCNSSILFYQWVAVPASGLPVVFNYN